MKKLLALSVLFTSLSAFGGPNVSSGPIGTENMISKQKIMAVLAELTDVNDFVESVTRTEGGSQYVATIRTANCFRQQLYNVTQVEPGSSGGLLYKASYVDLIALTECR